MDPQTFGTDLLTAAEGVLPYVGAALFAGLLVFSVVFGIRKGLAAIRDVSGDGDFEANWRQAYRDQYEEDFAVMVEAGWSPAEAHEMAHLDAMNYADDVTA